MISMIQINCLYQKHKEVVNYLIFGIFTTILSLAVYYILVSTILNPDNAIELQFAIIISWIAGVIFAYITNKKFVFDSKNNDIEKEILSFVGTRLVTLIMDMLIMDFGVIFLRKNNKIIKIISQIVVVVSNYLFSKILVFKKLGKGESL